MSYVSRFWKFIFLKLFFKVRKGCREGARIIFFRYRKGGSWFSYSRHPCRQGELGHSRKGWLRRRRRGVNVGESAEAVRCGGGTAPAPRSLAARAWLDYSATGGADEVPRSVTE